MNQEPLTPTPPESSAASCPVSPLPPQHWPRPPDPVSRDLAPPDPILASYSVAAGWRGAAWSGAARVRLVLARSTAAGDARVCGGRGYGGAPHPLLPLHLSSCSLSSSKLQHAEVMAMAGIRRRCAQGVAPSFPRSRPPPWIHRRRSSLSPIDTAAAATTAALLFSLRLLRLVPTVASPSHQLRSIFGDPSPTCTKAFRSCMLSRFIYSYFLQIQF
jgi:hypothetical protein